MPKQPDPKSHSPTRSSPRAAAALDVEVEVAGERRKVRLVSRDIGAGGIFLRTDEPAELWTKVKLVLSLPAGGTFEVGGEVVRSVPKKKAGAKGHPAGMAVAFDEVSRGKRKELVALVLDLCAQRPTKEEKQKQAPPPAKKPPKKPEAPAAKPKNDEDSTDALLDELDELLDSVESEINVEVDDTPESLDADDDVEASAEIIIEDVELVDLEEPLDEPETRPEALPPEGPEPKPPPVPAKKEGRVEDLRAALTEYKSNLKGDTYYDILEIEMKASAAEIEAAYQKLLGRLKPPGAPDSLPGDLLRELSAVLGKIRKAFAILSKPDRKRAYDFLIDNEVEDF
jgi:hypothetical protein